MRVSQQLCQYFEEKFPHIPGPNVIANPTKKVSKRHLNRKIRADARTALHRAIYFDDHADFGLNPHDLFWLTASKITKD